MENGVKKTAILHKDVVVFIHSFIHLLYVKPTEYIITTLKIKTSYQLSAIAYITYAHS